MSLSAYERKVWSQHGEDGIIQALVGSLKSCNKTCIEIGAAWWECNTRALIEYGWTGEIIDRHWSGPDRIFALKVTQQHVTPGSVRVGNPDADFFSLDIDSTDYFVADALLRRGFRPKIVCVETNTFIWGTRTVEYHEHFSRYELQPKIGLYFGCNLEAWKHLWGKYGYRYVGMESSFTNAFFVKADASDWPESMEPVGYQTYFCKKYKMEGADLQGTLDRLPFLDVKTPAYEYAFQAACAKRKGIELVMTWPERTHGELAQRFKESFVRHWKGEFKLTAYEDNQLHALSPELMAFEKRCGDPRSHGMIANSYNYVYDAVRWSYRIFALAIAARLSQAQILINIDADIITFADVDEAFIRDLMGDADIAYMPRTGMYSECSFVAYRLDNPVVREFIAEQEKFYTTGLIFSIKEGWTDCHAFDHLVRAYDELKYKDINEGLPPSMHPFINGPLGSKMDHLKGRRKQEGKSRKSDLVVKREETYWQ